MKLHVLNGNRIGETQGQACRRPKVLPVRGGEESLAVCLRLSRA